MKSFVGVFFLSLFYVCFMHAEVEEFVLQPAYIPGTQARLSIVSVENQTENSIFKLFYGVGPSRGLLLPQSVWSVPHDNKIVLNQSDPIRILCSKGAYEPIYIQDCGFASGDVQSGFEGPYYLSMWLTYPQASDMQKMFVRYAIKKGQTGKIGIKIDVYGNCQIIAHEDVIILS